MKYVNLTLLVRYRHNILQQNILPHLLAQFSASVRVFVLALLMYFIICIYVHNVSFVKDNFYFLKKIMVRFVKIK